MEKKSIFWMTETKKKTHHKVGNPNGTFAPDVTSRDGRERDRHHPLMSGMRFSRGDIYHPTPTTGVQQNQGCQPNSIETTLNILNKNICS